MLPWIGFLIILGTGLLIFAWGRTKALNSFSQKVHQGLVQLPCPVDQLHRHLIRLVTAESMLISSRITSDEPRQIQADLFLTISGHRRMGRVYTIPLILNLEPRSPTSSAFTWQVDSRQMAASFSGWCRLLRMVSILVMIAISLLMVLVVLPSENEAIRVQVIQTIHIGHFLWPPFLLIHQYNFHLSALETQLFHRFENLKYTLDQV